MIQFIKPHLIYTRIFADCIEIINITNGLTLKRKATNKFSTDRLLIGNFENASELLLEMLQEMSGKKFFNPSLWIVVQPMDKKEGGLSQVEERSIIDLMEHIGGTKIEFYLKDDLLTNEQITKMLCTK